MIINNCLALCALVNLNHSTTQAHNLKIYNNEQNSNPTFTNMP